MSYINLMRLMLWKKYFDTGYGLTGYFKVFIALFGADLIFNKNNINFVLWLGFAYGIFCFILGWAWLRFGFIEAETEIGNRFNPFVKQIRKHIRKRKI